MGTLVLLLAITFTVPFAVALVVPRGHSWLVLAGVALGIWFAGMYAFAPFAAPPDFGDVTPSLAGLSTPPRLYVMPIAWIAVLLAAHVVFWALAVAAGEGLARRLGRRSPLAALSPGSVPAAAGGNGARREAGTSGLDRPVGAQEWWPRPPT